MKSSTSFEWSGAWKPRLPCQAILGRLLMHFLYVSMAMYMCMHIVGKTPPYHYGTHYSSAMNVVSYLIRMEPFTQQFLTLQGGHFDLADRMFHTIGDAYNSASKTNMADVKELIPEFFYLPDFLINSNKFELGKFVLCSTKYLPSNISYCFISSHKLLLYITKYLLTNVSYCYVHHHISWYCRVTNTCLQPFVVTMFVSQVRSRVV